MEIIFRSMPVKEDEILVPLNLFLTKDILVKNNVKCLGWHMTNESFLGSISLTQPTVIKEKEDGSHLQYQMFYVMDVTKENLQKKLRDSIEMLNSEVVTIFHYGNESVCIAENYCVTPACAFIGSKTDIFSGHKWEESRFPIIKNSKVEEILNGK